MRAPPLALVVALAFVPAAALAQATPPAGPPPAGPGATAPAEPGTAPPGGGVAPPPGAITREEFVQRRAEAAGRLFDEIDSQHLGYVTRAQLRSFFAQRRERREAPPPQQQ